MSDKFIIFDTEAEGWEKANQEGEACNLPYFAGTGATRYKTAPKETTDGKWALDVTDYKHLTEDDVIVDSAVTLEGLAQAEYERQLAEYEAGGE